MNDNLAVMVAVGVLLLAVSGWMVWYVIQDSEEFKRQCTEAGGVPVISRNNKVCYEHSAVIKLPERK